MSAKIMIAACMAAFAATNAEAALTPQPGPADSRMRVVHYIPDEVVELTGDIGHQLMISFAPDERLENVSIGDARSWQITPNRRADLLFLKPLARAAPTNMTIVTNLRRYAFELRIRPRPPAGGEAMILYSLSFLYPAPPTPAPATPALKPSAQPEVVNAAYSYEGSRKLLPDRVFDDGRATYFSFPPTEDYPAIYAVGPDKSESVVNFSIRDGYVVVDQLARGFMLRRGAEATHLYNDGFRDVEPGPLSPRPRAKSRRHAP